MADRETVKDHLSVAAAHLSPNHPAVRAAARRAGVDVATYVRDRAGRHRRHLRLTG